MARFWTARDRCHGTKSPSTGFCNEPARRSSPTNSDFDEENGKSWCEATMRAVGFVPGARALGLRLMDRCRPVPENEDFLFIEDVSIIVRPRMFTQIRIFMELGPTQKLRSLRLSTRAKRRNTPAYSIFIQYTF